MADEAEALLALLHGTNPALRWEGTPTDGQVPVYDQASGFVRGTTQTDVDHGVPAGGTTGQRLAKASDADYDAGWVTDTDPDALTVSPESANFTAADNHLYVVDATAGIVTVTVPHTPSGLRVIVIKTDNSAHHVRVVMDSGSIVGGGGAADWIDLTVQGSSVEIVADGTEGLVANPAVYGGNVTFANLTVGVGGVGLLGVTDDLQHSGDAIGFFGASVHTKDAITGALSAVTDAAAQAVLTAIITALTDYGLVTNSTT